MKFLVRLFVLWLDAVTVAVRHIDAAIYSALRWLSGTNRPPRRPDPFTVEELKMSQLLCVYRVTYPPIPADETDVIGRRLVITVGDKWAPGGDNVDEVHSDRADTEAVFEVPQNVPVTLSLFHNDAGGNESSEPRTVEFTSKDLAPTKPDDFTVDFVEMTEVADKDEETEAPEAPAETPDIPADVVAEGEAPAAPALPEAPEPPADTPEVPAETPEAAPEEAPAAPEALDTDIPAADTAEVPPDVDAAVDAIIAEEVPDAVPDAPAAEATDETAPPPPQGDNA